MDEWSAGSALERGENLRDDDEQVAALWADPRALLLHIDSEGNLASDPTGERVHFDRPSEPFDPQRHFFVGTIDGIAYFAADRDALAHAGSLRRLASTLDDSQREMAAASLALVNWHRVAPRCAVCGSATRVTHGGLVRVCDACQRERYPRTDPAVIVAVLDAEDRLLLAHNRLWAPGRVSLVAGFVSAGESLEQAARREVAEEVGITITQPIYVGSQPWPFPRSLMVGFVARATESTVQADGVEIEHAVWYTRAEVDAAVDSHSLLLPGDASIASRIISAWRKDELPRP